MKGQRRGLHSRRLHLPPFRAEVLVEGEGSSQISSVGSRERR